MNKVNIKIANIFLTILLFYCPFCAFCNKIINFSIKLCYLFYKFWSLVRSLEKIREIIATVEQQGGIIIYTLVDQNIRSLLEEECAGAQIPCIPVLDPIISALGQFLGTESHSRPGSQHVMNAEYFSRIKAMEFALSHDDGQMTQDLNKNLNFCVLLILKFYRKFFLAF